MSIDPTKDTADLLLQALVVGDLDPQDPRVAARFAAEPGLAKAWQELAATLAVLRELDGGSGPASGPAPAVRPVDAMAAIRTFRREAARRARPWRLWIPAAALVAAALAVVWWLLPPPVPPVDPHLGGAIVLTPDGVPWPAGSPLHWTRVPGAVSYRLELQPLPDGPVVTIPGGRFGSGPLTSNEWAPAAEQSPEVPRRFRWRVFASDDDRVLAISRWAETWR